MMMLIVEQWEMEILKGITLSTSLKRDFCHYHYSQAHRTELSNSPEHNFENRAYRLRAKKKAKEREKQAG